MSLRRGPQRGRDPSTPTLDRRRRIRRAAAIPVMGDPTDLAGTGILNRVSGVTERSGKLGAFSGCADDEHVAVGAVEDPLTRAAEDGGLQGTPAL